MGRRQACAGGRVSLVKGGNVRLPVDLEVGGFLDFVLHAPLARSMPDVFAVLVDQSGAALGDSSVIFFNNPNGPSGSVSLIGERACVGARIRLNRLPETVASVVIAVSGDFEISGVGGVVQVRDGQGQILVDFPLAGLTNENTVVLGEVYRRLGQWRVRAISQGWSQGVAALLTSYGIVVEEERDQNADSAVPVSNPLPAVPRQSSTSLVTPAPGRPVIPPPPFLGAVFVPAPGWPQPPSGWQPHAGWQPNPTWPTAPPHWQFWRAPGPQPPARVEAGNPTRAMSASPAVAPAPRAGLFGPRRSDLVTENAHLRQVLHEIGGLELAEVHSVLAARQAELEKLESRISLAHAEIAQMQAQLIATETAVQAQEAGLFVYLHPLEDSAAYKSALAELKDELKQMVRAGTAITSVQQWTVNGSVREGTAMVRDFSKLMLRAYNAEADSAVRTVKPHGKRAAQDKLTKTRDIIARLGKTMSIRVSDAYHQLRLKEIELTAEYRAKVDEEKERARAFREEQREAEKAAREYRKEIEKLEREQYHYQRALDRGSWAEGSPEREDLLAKLNEIEDSIAGVRQREANSRAGYVYVISNIGAFGERMVKIGLTRRLDPMDRVRELGDASVPFRFDVHALIFSHDAVLLENQLHRHFEDRKVNSVNTRREFFYATPREVRDALAHLDRQYLLEFREEPEAEESRMSPAPPPLVGY